MHDTDLPLPSAAQKPLQKRAIATRAKLLDTAKSMISKAGYDALRIDELVKEAGVAKGTFFAHYKDKDRLMEHILGEELNVILDQMAQSAPPESVDQLVDSMAPLLAAMTRERYVFDLILRHSGAAAITEIGPIATMFIRIDGILAGLIQKGRAGGAPFRDDLSDALLGEGVMAFAVQSMALNFCAVNASVPLKTRLLPYLNGWVMRPHS